LRVGTRSSHLTAPVDQKHRGRAGYHA
jgi:hypothetical protein